MPNHTVSYQIWHPPDFEEKAKRRAGEIKDRMKEAKRISGERLQKAAERVVKESNCQYARNHVETTQSLSNVVVEASRIRLERDECAVDLAGIQGLALDLQRVCYVLSTTLGISMRQPLGTPQKGLGRKAVDPGAIGETIREAKMVVLEAINTLSLIRVSQEAAAGRVDLLKGAISSPEVDGETFEFLASGDPGVAEGALAVLNGVATLSAQIEIPLEPNISDKSEGTGKINSA